MPGRRITAVVGAAALLVGGAVQPGHAAPTPPAPQVVDAHGLAKTRIVGKPMRRAVPLRTRAFTAASPTVTVQVLDRDGTPPTLDEADHVTFIPLDGGDWLGGELQDGRIAAPLPAGEYAVSAFVRTAKADGTSSTTLIYLSKVVVAGDMSLTLDAREGRQIHAATDRADARPVATSVLLTQELGGRAETVAMLGGSDYITPAGTDSGLTFRIQARLTQNGSATSPYVYDIAAAREGIPADPGLRVRTRDLAAVRTTYAGEGGPACGGTHAGVDWGTGLSVTHFAGLGALPAVRTEYVSPGVTWRNMELVTDAGCGFGFDSTDERHRTDRYPGPGSYERNWSAAPLGPAAGWIYWGTGGEPAMAVSLLSSQDAQSRIAPFAHTTGTSILRDADGQVVATSDEPGTAFGWAHPGRGTYTLTVDADRAAPWSDLATRQHIVWNLTVDNAPRVALPVLRYSAAVDENGRARAGAEQTITVTPEGTEGTPTLQVSYDDGKSWANAPLSGNGTGWTAKVRNPASGFVSLRGTVPGVVDQTIVRAYAVR